MRLSTLTLLTFLLSINLYGYEDSDIDGVDDSIDKCLNTPFDDIVDEYGCSIKQRQENYNGKLTLKIGLDTGIIDSDSDTTFNYYIGYIYNNYSLSISSSNYINYSTDSKDSEDGDIYTNAGYLFKNENYNTKLSLGVKLATADDSVGTGEEDYFASLFFDYFIDSNKDAFFYYSYTLSGDSDEVDYKNYSTISVGVGNIITKNWYSSISYDFSESNYKGVDNYRAISWYNSYNFTKNLFTSLNYSYGLDDLSYEHTISLKLGISFE
jgi:hypothetical protein